VSIALDLKIDAAYFATNVGQLGNSLIRLQDERYFLGCADLCLGMRPCEAASMRKARCVSSDRLRMVTDAIESTPSLCCNDCIVSRLISLLVQILIQLAAKLVRGAFFIAVVIGLKKSISLKGLALWGFRPIMR